MKYAKIFPLLLAIALWGCSANGQIKKEEMLVKASALTKVAAALEGAVRFGNTPDNLSEAELLRSATAHDTDLLSPFGEYILRARRVGRFSSILMCSKDGRKGLLEDAGCSAKFDLHLWESPNAPCQFQLDLNQVCQR